MTVDVSVEYCGKRLRSPIFVPSLTPMKEWDPVDHAKNLAELARAGAGAVVAPTVGTMKIEHLRGKVQAAFSKIHAGRGFGYDGLMYTCRPVDNMFYTREENLLILKTLHQELKGTRDEVPIIASIMAGRGASEISDWVAVAKEQEESGYVDMIECNFGCPVPVASQDEAADTLSSFKGERQGPPVGAYLTQVPKAAHEVAKAVREAVNLPVIIKHSPELGYPLGVSLLSDALYASGVAAIALANSTLIAWEPDIWNKGKPKGLITTVGNKVTIGGGSGPFTRHTTHKFLIAHKKRHPEMEVCGICGIVDPEHAIETLMLGAQVAAVSPGYLWRGRNVIGRMNRFIADFMQKEGYRSVDEFRGIALDYYVSVDEIDFLPARAVVDTTRCTGCEICATNLCPALTMKDGMVSMAEKLCGGCGLCTVNCPRGCFEMKLL